MRVARLIRALSLIRFHLPDLGGELRKGIGPALRRRLQRASQQASREADRLDVGFPQIRRTTGIRRRRPLDARKQLVDLLTAQESLVAHGPKESDENCVDAFELEIGCVHGPPIFPEGLFAVAAPVGAPRAISLLAVSA